MEENRNDQIAKCVNSTEQTASALVRTYKDSVFRLLFNDNEHALELYNAISGNSYGPDTPFRFTTLEEAILQTKKKRYLVSA